MFVGNSVRYYWNSLHLQQILKEQCMRDFSVLVLGVEENLNLRSLSEDSGMFGSC